MARSLVLLTMLVGFAGCARTEVRSRAPTTSKADDYSLIREGADGLARDSMNGWRGVEEVARDWTSGWGSHR
jgi:hypothetical protein